MERSVGTILGGVVGIILITVFILIAKVNDNFDNIVRVINK